VLVDPQAADTGQVSVTAYNVVDVTGTVAVNGPAVSAALTTPGQRARWSFTGTRGQTVHAVVNASTVPGCSIYNSFGILNPDGSPVGTQWNMCAGALTPLLTLPGDGTYTLLVDPGGVSTGSVTARVIDPVVLVNGIEPPAGVTVGRSAVVSVQVRGGPGNPNDQVRLSVVGSGGGAYIGTATVPASGGPISFTMPSTPGTYQFRLFANGLAWIETSTTVTVQ
jgi:hypothetical protein